MDGDEKEWCLMSAGEVESWRPWDEGMMNADVVDGFFPVVMVVTRLTCAESAKDVVVDCELYGALRRSL